MHRHARDYHEYGYCKGGLIRISKDSSKQALTVQRGNCSLKLYPEQAIGLFGKCF